MLASVSFLFKNNIEIGQVMVFVLDDIDQVVDQIKQIKRHNEEFQLLFEVYALMVYQNLIGFLVLILQKDKGEYCHGIGRYFRKNKKERFQNFSIFIFGNAGSLKADGFRL